MKRNYRVSAYLQRQQIKYYKEELLSPRALNIAWSAREINEAVNNIIQYEAFCNKNNTVRDENHSAKLWNNLINLEVNYNGS